MSKLPQDPSGIIVHHESLCIVGNRSNRQYFRFDATPLRESPFCRLKDLELIEHVKLSHKAAKDLESIEVLEDQIVVLSENSRRVLVEDRTAIDYSDISHFQERDGRGLEGMCVRKNADGSSIVAVIWEGSERGHKSSAERPHLLILQVGHGAVGTRIQLRPEYWDSRTRPLQFNASWQGEPFRVPDLVWCRFRSSERVLSDSESSDLGSIQRGNSKGSSSDVVQVEPTEIHSRECPADPRDLEPVDHNLERTDKPTLLVLLSHHHDAKQKFLQAYDELGNPVGQAASLIELGMPESLLSLNWEGLCWFTDHEGKDSLLLVNDTDQKSQMYVCKVRPPSGIDPE